MRSCGCADLGHTCELGAGDRRSNLNPQAELPEEDGEGQVARLAPGDLALSLLPVQLGAQRILGGAHLQAIKQSSNHHQEAIRNHEATLDDGAHHCASQVQARMIMRPIRGHIRQVCSEASPRSPTRPTPNDEPRWRSAPPAPRGNACKAPRARQIVHRAPQLDCRR